MIGRVAVALLTGQIQIQQLAPRIVFRQQRAPAGLGLPAEARRPWQQQRAGEGGHLQRARTNAPVRDRSSRSPRVRPGR